MLISPPRAGVTVNACPAVCDARAILIAGPTASGKSRLALRLAERDGRHRHQCRQHAGLSRAAHPDGAADAAEDEARAPHALYGFVGGAEAYSAGRYAVDAAAAIAEARAQGRVPIIVGGTGLYFKVLLEGLSPVPAIDPDVRAYWRAQAAQRPAPELHAHAGAARSGDGRAPDADRSAAHRARARGAGEHRPLAGRLAARARRARAGGGETVRLLVLPDRDAHRPRASMPASTPCWRRARSRRCARCSALGLLRRAADHARARAWRRWPPICAGELQLEEAAAAAKAETRQYAKRQLTWLRRNMRSWKPIDTQQMERISRKTFVY